MGCVIPTNTSGVCRPSHAPAGGAAGETFYVVVEKILAEDERLPKFAGVAGTTGYEWLNVISRVLLDQRVSRRLTRCAGRERRTP